MRIAAPTESFRAGIIVLSAGFLGKQESLALARPEPSMFYFTCSLQRSQTRREIMGDFDIDPYEDLPEDPEAAFLRLEAHFRADCDRRLAEADREERTDVIYVSYIAQVLAAITALGLETEFKSEVPSIENVDFNTYLNFNKDVMHYRTVLRIRRSLRTQGYSVQFDDSAKRKIHHHLDQVLDIFNKLEVEDKKEKN
jgi:hypothetical protein